MISPCPFCDGRNDECEHCEGMNEIPIYRCPQSLATREYRDCVTAAVLVEKGILPSEGGWHDQAATFVAAYPIAAREIAEWQRIAEQIAMRKAQAKSKR